MHAAVDVVYPQSWYGVWLRRGYFTAKHTHGYWAQGFND